MIGGQSSKAVRRLRSVAALSATALLLVAGSGTASGAVTDGRIAYQRTSAAGSHDIWTINPDGTGARRLLVAADRLRYSPTGDRILFVKTINGVPRLVLANADGTTRTVLAGSWTGGDWSPDATRLVTTRIVNGHSELFVRAVARGAATQLTRRGDQGCDATEPDWGPNGVLYAVHCPRSSFPVAIPGKTQIHQAQLPGLALEADTTRLFKLSDFDRTSMNQFVRAPRWTATGDILFTGCVQPSRSHCNENARYNIFRIDAAGLRALTAVPDDRIDTGYTHAVPAPAGPDYAVTANLPVQYGIQIHPRRNTIDPVGGAVQDWQPVPAP